MHCIVLYGGGRPVPLCGSQKAWPEVTAHSWPAGTGARGGGNGGGLDGESAFWHTHMLSWVQSPVLAPVLKYARSTL